MFKYAVLYYHRFYYISIYLLILCAHRACSSTLFEAIFQPQKLHCHRPNDGRQRRNDRPPLDNQTFVAAAAPLTPRL